MPVMLGSANDVRSKNHASSKLGVPLGCKDDDKIVNDMRVNRS